MTSLSATAPPFVPGISWGAAPPVYAGSKTATQPQPQQQWSGVGPTEFVPGVPWPGASGAPVPPQPLPQQKWSNGNEQPSYTNSGWEPDYVIMVKDILFSLSISPGSFEDYMRSMAENLNATVRTEKDLGTVADIIFEQAVLEPNFRYTGARACDYLTSHLVLPPNVGKFRSHINQRVKDAVESREVMAKDLNKMTRLHGATMFLAELFLTSQVQVGNGPQRILIYRLALNELMNTLVNNASSENLKCLGLLLKLSGKEIEDYDREQNDSRASDQLNGIFLKARKHVTNETIEKSVRELWLQLIELRAKRWGQGDAASFVGGAAPPPPPAAAGSGDGFMSASGDAPMFSSQPVFYNAKGQVISAAEAGFGDEYEGDFENYADYQNYDEYSSNDPYTDYTSSAASAAAAAAAAAADPYSEFDWDPNHYQQDASAESDYADGFDELDAEIQAAFSDFLIETGQGDHS